MKKKKPSKFKHRPASMHLILNGYISFWLGLLSALITAITAFLLFYLPPATYIFERMYNLAWIPLIMSMTGLAFYCLQWRIFVARIVRAALLLNSLAFLSCAYLIIALSRAII